MLLNKNMIRNLLIFNVLAAIFAFEVYADEVLDVGDAESTYSGNVRGFTFTAPTDFTITGIDVPTDASSNPFSAAILKVNDTNFSDWTYGSSTLNYDVLYDIRGQATAVSGLNITITQGDQIGVLGNRGDINSYGSGPYVSSINGNDVVLSRMFSQNVISSASSPFSLSISNSVDWYISRVFLTYSITTPTYSITTPTYVLTVTILEVDNRDKSSIQYRPVAQTVNPDIFQSNIPICESNVWLSGMSVVGNGKVTHYVDYKHKDECFKYEVKVLPEDVDSRSEAQVFKHLGSSEFDVYKYRPS